MINNSEHRNIQLGFELFTEKELGPYGEFSILSGLTPFQIMIILLFIKGEPA